MNGASRSAAAAAPLSYHERTLRAIRRILRSVDRFSRQLEVERGVTVPQLSCLLLLAADGPLSLTGLAKAADVSPSTAVGIVDRLVRKGLVHRSRSATDRRQVLISVSPTGRALVAAAPSPLQDRLAGALDELPELEQASIALSLERIVGLMGIQDLDASPILDRSASLTTDPTDPPGVAEKATAAPAPTTPAAARHDPEV